MTIRLVTLQKNLVNFMNNGPTYAQSNGLAEKTVQTAKRILSKAKSDVKIALISLLEYRNTPLDIGFSPAELLMGRQLGSLPLKTLLPKCFILNRLTRGP